MVSKPPFIEPAARRKKTLPTEVSAADPGSDHGVPWSASTAFWPWSKRAFKSSPIRRCRRLKETRKRKRAVQTSRYAAKR